MLPLYKAQLEETKEGDSKSEEAIGNFMTSSNTIKEGLANLKTKLGKLLDNINTSLDLFNLQEDGVIPNTNLIKNTFAHKYEELKKAIEMEDNDYILNKMRTKDHQLRIDDDTKDLFGSIGKLLSSFTDSKDIDTLDESLNEFNKRYRTFVDLYDSSEGSKYVYGVCGQQSLCGKLCRFDTTTEKFEALVSVPLCASSVKINKSVFFSGGYNPLVNTLSEWNEINETLVPREPMKHPKWCHSVQAIGSKGFATIGGWDNSQAIAVCEEYSIPDNKWSPLPSLVNANCYHGTVYLSNKFLYAIGGYAPKDTVEMLDMSTKKEWVIVKILVNDMIYRDSAAAFPVTNNEVIVISGSVGVFNVAEKTIKKKQDIIKIDNLYYNSVHIVKNQAYVIGLTGNIHIYDIRKRTLRVIDYSTIIL